MAWLKQYQFYVFVFWLVKFTVSRQYDIIVERVQCIRSPNDLCYNMSCGVRLISRNLTYIDAECSLREPIDNLMVRMILFYKFAEYRKFLVDIEVDVCDYLKNTTSTLLAKAVLTSVIGQLTNITSCPIKDTVKFIGLDVNNEYNPPFIPAGRYRSETRFSSNGRPVGMATLYFSVKPRGALKLEMGK